MTMDADQQAAYLEALQTPLDRLGYLTEIPGTPDHELALHVRRRSSALWQMTITIDDHPEHGPVYRWPHFVGADPYVLVHAVDQAVKQVRLIVGEPQALR